MFSARSDQHISTYPETLVGALVALVLQRSLNDVQILEPLELHGVKTTLATSCLQDHILDGNVTIAPKVRHLRPRAGHAGHWIQWRLWTWQNT